MNIDNPQACGVGNKERCCIFVTLGGEGWECEQHGPLRNVLLERHQRGLMSASRVPIKLFPDCQTEAPE